MIEQKNRYSEQEIGLLESTFKDQENLLVLFRAFLLQDELSAEEVKYLKVTVGKPEVLKVMRKAFTLDLDKRAVLNGMVDLFSGMDLHPTSKDHALLHIDAQRLVKQFLEERFSALEGKEDPDPIMFDSLVADSGNDDEDYINFIARNDIVKMIDNIMRHQIQTMAETNISKEERMAKLKKDSTK